MAKKKKIKAKQFVTQVDTHSLLDLVGKKIKKIVLEEVDETGDEFSIKQFYVITCTDGEKFVLASGASERSEEDFTSTLWTPDEYEDYIDSIEPLDPTSDDEDDTNELNFDSYDSDDEDDS